MVEINQHFRNCVPINRDLMWYICSDGLM